MFDLAKRWPSGLTRRSVALSLVALAVVLAILLFADRPISVWAQASPGFVVTAMGWLTQWGQSAWLLYPALVLLLLSLAASWLARDRGLKLAALEQAGLFGYLFAAIAVPGIVTNLIKAIVGRARPVLFDQVGSLSFQFHALDDVRQSFPSGHTTNATALAFALGFLSPGLFWPGLAFAAGIAASRVILGQHYPTDAVAGAAVGSVCAYLVRNAFASGGWAFRWSADGRAVPRTAALRRLFRSRK